VLSEKMPRLQILARLKVGMLENLSPTCNRVTLFASGKMGTRRSKRTPRESLRIRSFSRPLVERPITEQSLANRIRSGCLFSEQ